MFCILLFGTHILRTVVSENRALITSPLSLFFLTHNPPSLAHTFPALNLMSGNLDQTPPRRPGVKSSRSRDTVYEILLNGLKSQHHLALIAEHIRNANCDALADLSIEDPLVYLQAVVSIIVTNENQACLFDMLLSGRQKEEQRAHEKLLESERALAREKKARAHAEEARALVQKARAEAEAARHAALRKERSARFHAEEASARDSYDQCVARIELENAFCGAHSMSGTVCANEAMTNEAMIQTQVDRFITQFAEFDVTIGE